MVSCHYCGNPKAEGYAFIDDLRYCHGDDVEVTCYMRAQWTQEDLLESWFKDV